MDILYKQQYLENIEISNKIKICSLENEFKLISSFVSVKHWIYEFDEIYESIFAQNLPPVNRENVKTLYTSGKYKWAIVTDNHEDERDYTTNEMIMFNGWTGAGTVFEHRVGHSEIHHNILKYECDTYRFSNLAIEFIANNELNDEQLKHISSLINPVDLISSNVRGRVHSISYGV